MALRGLEVSYEAVRDREAKLLPGMDDELRKRRSGKRHVSGASWHVDETYLYRAIDRDGNLIDAMLSEHRDMKAAKAFFRSARALLHGPFDARPIPSGSRFGLGGWTSAWRSRSCG